MNDLHHKTSFLTRPKDKILFTDAGVIIPKLEQFKEIIDTAIVDLTITIEESRFAPQSRNAVESDSESDEPAETAATAMLGSTLGSNQYAVYKEATSDGDGSPYIVVPKFWFRERFGDRFGDTSGAGDEHRIELTQYRKMGHQSLVEPRFTMELRDYQKPIVDTVHQKMLTGGGGILSVPCGKGKTCMAIKLATMLGLKCLVIVHRSDFILQWKADIEKLTNLRVGVIRQNKIDVENKDIVIGMLKSISMKDYHHSVFGDFGLVVVDEVHNISTRLYSKALCRLMPRYTLGLSATPYRDDKMDRVYRWFLGPILYQETNTIEVTVKVQMIKYQLKKNATAIDAKRFRYIYNPRTQMPNTPIMISNLAKVVERNQFLIHKLIEILVAEPHRKVLLLASRVCQLESLMADFDREKARHESIKNLGSAMYVGGLKPTAYLVAKEKDVLFATYEMVGEGFNLEKLNTLMMCSPRSNSKTSNKLQQFVGRILRTQAGSDGTVVPPLVVDIHDQLNVFSGQGDRRLEYYRSAGYHIDHSEVVDGVQRYIRTEEAKKVVPKKTKSATVACATVACATATVTSTVANTPPPPPPSTGRVSVRKTNNRSVFDSDDE